MANAEMQLISRIVRTGDLAAVIDWGITDNDFRTVEAKGIWRTIAGYYADARTRGAVIGERAYASAFPNNPLYDDLGMTLESLCFEVRRSRLVAEAKEACLGLIENIEINPLEAIAMVHVHAQNLLALGDSKNHDVRFADSMIRQIQQYDLLKRNIYASTKLSYPWEILNEVNRGGIQESDFVVLYGRPKSMKTWVLVNIIAWAFQMEKTALIYTKEMTPDDIYLRVAACIGRIPYQELRSGKLMVEDELLLRQLAVVVADKYTKANLICLDGREAGAGGDNVPWLQAKVEKYKPDIVFVDGMYLLSDASSNKRTADWQRVTNISRAIRSMVLHTKVPVIATMQATRSAAKHGDGNLDEIAYADAVAQDATLAIRVINEKHQQTIACVIAGAREFMLHGFRINGIPATDFSFHSKMSEKEIVDAERSDAPDEDGKNRKGKGTKPRSRGESSIAQAEAEKKSEQAMKQQLARM